MEEERYGNRETFGEGGTETKGKGEGKRERHRGKTDASGLRISVCPSVLQPITQTGKEQTDQEGE